MVAEVLQEACLPHHPPSPHAHNGHHGAVPAPTVHSLARAPTDELVESEVIVVHPVCVLRKCAVEPVLVRMCRACVNLQVCAK